MSAASSFVSITRGALRALRYPRLLAGLSRDPRSTAGAYEQEVATLLGGLPRCVPLESLLGPEGDMLPAFTFLDDTSTVMDLLLLRAIAARYDARTMFEIGTFRGESAYAVANAGIEVHTLSLPDDELRAQGVQDSLVEAHRTLSSGELNITHTFGDSAVFDTGPYAGWADIVFIDGDHSRGAVERDTRRFWAMRSSRVGAVVWHDAFSSPLVPRWEVLAGIGAGVPASERSHLVNISNTLCVAWLPDAAELPTVPRSYVPRTVFSVKVAPLIGWRSRKDSAEEAHEVAGDHVAARLP